MTYVCVQLHATSTAIKHMYTDTHIQMHYSLTLPLGNERVVNLTFILYMKLNNNKVYMGIHCTPAVINDYS